MLQLYTVSLFLSDTYRRPGWWPSSYYNSDDSFNCSLTTSTVLPNRSAKAFRVYHNAVVFFSSLVVYQTVRYRNFFSHAFARLFTETYGNMFFKGSYRSTIKKILQNFLLNNWPPYMLVAPWLNILSVRIREEPTFQSFILCSHNHIHSFIIVHGMCNTMHRFQWVQGLELEAGLARTKWKSRWYDPVSF
jgi:hypothetical protein